MDELGCAEQCHLLQSNVPGLSAGRVQEAEELQREMNALEAERAGLLRDAALAGEMEAQYAKRGTLQVGSLRGPRWA